MSREKPVILSLLPESGDELLAAPALLCELSREDFFICSLVLSRKPEHKQSFRNIGDMGFALIEPVEPAEILPEPDPAGIERVIGDGLTTLAPTVVLSPSPWIGLPGYSEVGEAVCRATRAYAASTGSAPVLWLWGSPFISNLAYFSSSLSGPERALPQAELEAAESYSAYLAHHYLGFASESPFCELLLEAQVSDALSFHLGPRRILDTENLLPPMQPQAEPLTSIGPRNISF